MVVGESRSDLLQWLNTTLDLNYHRIEECGKGGAFCQLMDCIYGGVPMAKVKFDNATTEYDYRQNWKIVQSGFTKHGITKVIDVERLIKCRLQDNLELLQWFKKVWTDTVGVNDNYDAKARRKPGAITSNGAGSSGRNSVMGSRTPSTSSSLSNPTSRRTTLTSASTPTQAHSPKIVNSTQQQRRVSSGPTRTASTPQVSQTSQAQQSTKVAQLNKELTEALADVSHLNTEIQEYKISAETLETERNFYFNKLREIEILVQNINDLIDTNNFAELKELTVVDLNKKIQTILYSTEEGFQTNAFENEAIENHHNNDYMDADLSLQIDDEIDNESF